MKIGLLRALRVALVLAAPAGVLATSGCASMLDYQYTGPAYVIGHYTCVNPSSGQLDYCVEYSDGTSSLVPWSIYSTVLYGQVLTVSHSAWAAHATIYTRPGYYARDVYHVHYHVARVYPSIRVAQAHVYSSATVYGGMSYRNRSGQVAYRSPTGKTYASSLSTTSGSRTVYRSSGYRGRH